MSLTKSKNDIEAMRRGGALLSRALQAAVDAVKPGVSMKVLDEIATRVIEEGGGEPSFKGYKAGGSKPFPSTLCVSRNEEVVHGIGSRNDILNEGDIVGLDIGLWLDGLCTDMAASVPVGNVSKERLNLLRVTRAAMEAGIDAALVGSVIGDIGNAIEDSLNTKKYGIVRGLVGHGVGHAVHEDPYVPNYRTRKFPRVPIVKDMCLAIEPMITTGSEDVDVLDDEWTVVTDDGSDAAHFEVTIVTTENGPEILTPQPKVPLLD